jgi:hypothetical protein
MNVHVYIHSCPYNTVETVFFHTCLFHRAPSRRVYMLRRTECADLGARCGLEQDRADRGGRVIGALLPGRQQAKCGCLRGSVRAGADRLLRKGRQPFL